MRLFLPFPHPPFFFGERGISSQIKGMKPGSGGGSRTSLWGLLFLSAALSLSLGPTRGESEYVAAAAAGTFPPRGCALFAKSELTRPQLSGPRARERRGPAESPEASSISVPSTAPRPAALGSAPAPAAGPGAGTPRASSRRAGPRHPRLAQHPAGPARRADGGDSFPRPRGALAAAADPVSRARWRGAHPPVRGVQVALELGGAPLGVPEAPGHVSKHPSALPLGLSGFLFFPVTFPLSFGGLPASGLQGCSARLWGGGSFSA